VTEGAFQIPILFDLFATFVFGVTGALVALRRGYAVVGLFAVAFVSGLGGGLIRDGLFIQQGPPMIATDGRYIVVILVACLAGLFFHNWVKRLAKAIALLDAAGLGAYAVVGVEKSLAAGLSIAAAVLVGVINAVGGGLFRDLLVRDEPLLLKPGQFYALAAFGGCLLFVLLLVYFRMPASRAGLITVAATFAVRILAIRFNWRTPPLYRPDTPVE
jgi:uncharacterized membrane protein YeiH